MIEEATVLCFLPPMVPPSRCPPPKRPGTGVAATIIASLAAVALLTPFGWVRTQPVYDLRLGMASRLGPRAAERALLTQLDRPAVAARAPAHYAYLAGVSDRIALPPGLAVEAATGALTGVPTLAGTYTVGVMVSDGATRPVSGPLFKVRVRPAT